MMELQQRNQIPGLPVVLAAVQLSLVAWGGRLE